MKYIRAAKNKLYLFKVVYKCYNKNISNTGKNKSQLKIN